MIGVPAVMDASAPSDRYQSGLGQPGIMDTERWFAALMSGIDGPLGSVLDVGCAEGVMCVLAARAGAMSVTGIGLHDDRMAAAIAATAPYPNVEILERWAHEYTDPADTVVFSMMAHWLGPDETRRFASMARRNFCIVFRLANPHYDRPLNGSWFPTFEELDALIGHPRSSETLLLTQDSGKEVWAATYRTDLTVHDGLVVRGSRIEPYRDGTDLHGDAPFRLRQGRPILQLSGSQAVAVRELVRKVAQDSLADGTYPSDFSPRNVIVSGAEAWLIDDEPAERVAGTHVAPEWLPIWQATLSSIGLAFDGDLRSLL